MMKSDPYKRGRVLDNIRKALSVTGDEPARIAAVEDRIAARKKNTLPARTALPHDERLALFVSTLEGQSAKVHKVDDPDLIPALIADILRGSNQPLSIRMGSDPFLAGLAWSREPTLERLSGKAQSSDQTSLVKAFAGVAETGTLVMTSGPANPVTLNYLPEAEIVVIRKAEIEGSYEAMWDRLRSVMGGTAMPRTVNFISGPSRTADIEQTIVMGAHGPKRLEVIIVMG